MGIYIYGYICGRDIYGWDICVYIYGGGYFYVYIWCGYEYCKKKEWDIIIIMMEIRSILTLYI